MFYRESIKLNVKTSLLGFGCMRFPTKDGKKLDNVDEYVKSMNNRVSNAYSISKMILDTDYYTYVLGSE